MLHHFHGGSLRRYFIQAAGAGLPGMGFDLGLLLPNTGTPGLRLVEYPPKLLKHQLVQLLAGRPILLFPVQAQLF